MCVLLVGTKATNGGALTVRSTTALTLSKLDTAEIDTNADTNPARQHALAGDPIAVSNLQTTRRDGLRRLNSSPCFGTTLPDIGALPYLLRSGATPAFKQFMGISEHYSGHTTHEAAIIRRRLES